MRIIPKEILIQFDSALKRKEISPELHNFYRKWLRFYLDFCHKYCHESKEPESLSRFINKLREKNQDKKRQKQAYDSVLIYYELSGIVPNWVDRKPQSLFVQEKTAPYKTETSQPNNQWKQVYTTLSDEIEVRHYSPKTFKAL